MDSNVFTAISKGDSLPLASLRLLVPPFQLLAASMWHVLQNQAVRSYWEVAEFVSLVVDMVPELLMYKHRTELNLGLRARYILELCRSEQPVKPELILSYLDKMTSPNPVQEVESNEEVVKENFVESIRALLEDPEKKRDFFTDVFPAEYGPQYDSDLQTLFSEFLCRLAQLLPVPDLQQTASWLGAEGCLLEDCARTVSEPSDLKNLLRHHRKLGHLEQHVPPAGMANSILASLSALPSQKEAQMAEQPQTDPPQGVIDGTWALMVVGDNVEIVAFSDHAEVEVGATSNIKVEKCFESPEDSLYTKENGTKEEAEHSASSQEKVTTGPHDCPDCRKSFKFASSLLAHRVIHTGERPHRCSDCGRRFSFRQSLDRHKRTHGAGRGYACLVCGEAFHSPSARAQHKQTHKEDGAYTCRRCNQRFSCELTFVKHLKTHEEDGDVSTGSSEERPVVGNAEGMEVEPAEPDGPVQVDDVVLPVNVRTSGRRRRPTMKVLNLQKHVATKQKKDVTRVGPVAQKPSPFISSEHSYGSSRVSKDGDESSPTDASAAAFSRPQRPLHNSETAQVDKVHPAGAEGDESSPQPLPDGGGRYSCSDCGKMFRFQSLLKAHWRVHTGEQPFSCSQCGRQFSFKQSLERHKQTHKVRGEPFTSAGGRHRDEKNGEYSCSECGRVFAWKAALARHLRTHGLDADEANDSFKCPHCELVFSCASHLSRHLPTHSGERGHTCNCGKSFAYRAALTAHQRIHRKERPHACAECGKGFLYKGGLLSHMKIHSEEKPFMCSFCGKSFKRERNMKKHERYHTREDVFRCSQCDKSFVYKATLIRHELTHSGERPYLCSDCGKGFFSHAELLKHERFHTGHKPFQCPYCGKRFTQSCYLTVHLRYHTGARPYSCSECDKSFLSANRLKRHQRTHSGEKPYLCGKCGKRFRQSYHLKMHQRTHS